MTAPTFDRPEAHALADLAAHYELLGELGRGGSAVVYHARDRRLDRDVALKVVRLAPALAPHERSVEVERLAREARTIARLTHPGVVAVYAVHELGDGLAVAMQCVRGRTLKQLIADEGALDPARAVAVLRDVAAALAYAHAHGIVHRDVKPENIFVDDAGRALLADFGAARGITADVRVTRTGMTVGTPAYMSPEQIDDAPLDGRSDLYSLGLVAWEALTGRRPWSDAGLYQLLHHQKHDVLAPIAAVRPPGAPPVPLAVEYVVERLLEKRPGARWASADAVAAQLERPSLPADFPLWKRAHNRRVADLARAGTPDAALTRTLSAPTEQWRPTPPGGATPPTSTPPAAAGRVPPVSDAPSWADERVHASRPRRAWYAAGAVALLAAASVPLARRAPAPPARARSVAIAVADSTRTTTIPAPPVRAAAPSAPPPAAAATVLGTPAPATVARSVIDTARRGGRGLAVAPAGPVVSAPTTAPGRPVGPPRVAVVPLSAPGMTIATVAVEPAPPPAPAPAFVPLDRTAIAAGGRHSCALDPAGHATCWGDNGSGQLGSGDLTPRDTPTPVAGDLRFVQLTTGSAHSCGLTVDGDAYCWGDDDAGQLGDATTSLRDAPVRVGGSTRFRAIRAGLDYTCALSASATVLCWGANSRGQLGDGTSQSHATPAPVTGVRAITLAVGWRHTCALTSDGSALCWGDNASGQLGDGSRGMRATAAPVAGGLHFTAIAAGANHTCASTASGLTYCWGTGGVDGATHLAPARVDGGAAFVTLAAGSIHTCGRTAAGAVYCWGRNTYGQLGDGTNVDHWRPARVPGGPYTALSAAGAHTCTVSAGTPVCWGYNVSGQLGDGSRAHRATPTRAVRASS